MHSGRREPRLSWLVHRVLICDEMKLGPLDFPGVQLDYLANMPRPDLLQALPQYDALITRSRTKVDAELLAAGSRLRVIGRGGVGVDNIDLEAASRRGILVLNAPEANTISAAELAIAHLLSAARGLTRSDAKIRAGTWDRKFLGLELAGKRLGIVGLGRIGSSVAQRARGLGMSVLAYDPYIAQLAFDRVGAERAADLPALLGAVQFLTVHTPLTEETRGMIGSAELALLPRDAVVVNAARGGIIDEPALAAALRAGQLFAAAIDVFVDEPPGADHPLVSVPNLSFTAHLGANTLEAQSRVGEEIVSRVLAALDGDISRGAVNAPALDPHTKQVLGGYLELAEKLGKIAGQLLPAASALEVELCGRFPADPAPLVPQVLVGYLSGVTDEPANPINARALCRERGLKVSVQTCEDVDDYQSELVLTARTEGSVRSVAGTVFGRSPRLTRLRNYRLEVVPEGYILIVSNRDRPGAVAQLSSRLGDWGINIAGMSLGREARGGLALFTLTLDDRPSAAQMEELRRLPVVDSLFLVEV